MQNTPQKCDLPIKKSLANRKKVIKTGSIFMGRGRDMGRGSAESRSRGMGRGSAGEEFGLGHGQGPCRGMVEG